MSIVAFVRDCGGFCTRADAIAATSRREVDRALRTGDIVRVARGRYGLPSLDEAMAVAHAANGVLSHTSAALWHGWEVKQVPEQPDVLFPRKRRVTADVARKLRVHRRDLLAEEITGGICTSIEVTLEQCFRGLPFDEALCVADSALRHGVTPATLRRVVAGIHQGGRQKAQRVVREASPEAANVFETCLRAIALDVPGLHVRPQVRIVGRHDVVRPDLVDEHRRIVLEADSFGWHGDRAALKRDARRYNLLVVDGWIVLRFAWEDVMFDPDYIHQVLVDVVALVDARTQLLVCPRCAA